jgi:hypothetical protein
MSERSESVARALLSLSFEDREAVLRKVQEAYGPIFVLRALLKLPLNGRKQVINMIKTNEEKIYNAAMESQFPIPSDLPDKAPPTRGCPICGR